MHVPYLEGERTPNLPLATGELHGMTLAQPPGENLARAAVEGLLGRLAEAMNGLRQQGVAVEQVTWSVAGHGRRRSAN